MILDMAGGLLLAVAVGILTNVKFKLFFILFGVGSAVCVDFDAVVYFFVWFFRRIFGRLRKRERIDEVVSYHRELFHYPVIVSGAGGIIVFVVLGFPWFLLWTSANLLHFIHDTISDCWGVQWLFPFSSKYFTLVSHSPKKIINNKKEQRRIVAKYGDSDWFKKSMQVNNKETIIQFSFLIIILVVAFWWVL